MTLETALLLFHSVMSVTHLGFNRLFLCCFCMACSAVAVRVESVELNAGPLAAEFALTLTPGKRTEAVGPLFSYQQTPSERQWIWAPLLSISKDEAVDTSEIDLVYPLLTYRRFGSEYRFQLFQLFSFSGGESQSEVKERRFTLFPLYFQQRSADPAKNYTALIPFYGTLKHHLFRDEIKFVMMPVYVKTLKADVVTENYLMPFFHLRHGDGLHGWQLWPFTGRERKSITTRTNGFGESDLVGGYDKFFVLWPVYFDNHLEIGTLNPQRESLVFPFYGSLRSPQRDSSMYLWPLFTSTEDRERKYHEWGAPWPLVVFTRGEGKTCNRLWPLYSRAHNATLESGFWFWPLYKYNRVHSPPLEEERTRILLFLYSALTDRNSVSGAVMRRTDLWPFLTARRDFDGNQRWQALALLEAFLPTNKKVEEIYSPLWALWRSERNARTGASSQSLFWNLYRCDTTPTNRKCSLLFGLFQYQSGPEGKRWRWFHLPSDKARSVPHTRPVT